MNTLLCDQLNELARRIETIRVKLNTLIDQLPCIADAPAREPQPDKPNPKTKDPT